jgi:hypothetical protein
MATFPTSLPNRTGTPLGLMTVANARAGKLSAALAAGATTAQVDFDPVAAGYPTSGYLSISQAGVPREVVKYGGRSATGGSPGSFTSLTRAQDGTTDQAHNAGDDIGMALFAGVVNSLADELVAGLTKLGTGSSTPSTVGHVLRSNGSGGSGWQQLGQEYIKVPYVTIGFASATTQSFSTGGATLSVAFDAEISDSNAMFPAGTGADANRIKLSHSGLWLFACTIIFSNSSLTGPSSIALQNMTTATWFGGYDWYYSNRTNPSASSVAVTPASANDIIGVFIVNSGPSTLTTYSGGSGAGPTFTATYLSPS